MSRSGTIILLGVLIIIIPLSGLPIAFRSFLTIVLGACVFAAGLSMRKQPLPARDSTPSGPPQSPIPPSISSI